jgi:glycine/D-amino acid oxidase-like deaminating enzyme
MMRKLDLRTGRPVWLAYPAPRIASSPLIRDVRADVLVVGLGISAAMICDALTEAGLSVVGVDRRRPLAGSTPATTALVQFEIDQPLVKLGPLIGKERAMRAWRRSRMAVQNLHGRISDLGIDCGAALRPSLYLAGNVLNAGALAEEGEARREAGLYARLLKPAEVKETYGIEGRAGLISEGNIALNPRRLAASLLNAAAARGARYFRDTEIVGLEQDGDGIAATTKSGRTIRASHVVLATGYELMDMVPRAPHSIVSTWAIATKPQKSRLWARDAFIWESSDPYLYMRATDDGRVICGGEDEDFADEETRDALIDEKTAKIAEKLGRMLPGIDPQPEFRWAGSFGTTATGLPFIGRVPRRKGIHAVMGYGGNGITYSRIASEIITTTITGGRDPDADLYAFPT